MILTGSKGECGLCDWLSGLMTYDVHFLLRLPRVPLSTSFCLMLIFFIIFVRYKKFKADRIQSSNMDTFII